MPNITKQYLQDTLQKFIDAYSENPEKVSVLKELYEFILGEKGVGLLAQHRARPFMRDDVFVAEYFEHNDTLKAHCIIDNTLVEAVWRSGSRIEEPQWIYKYLADTDSNRAKIFEHLKKLPYPHFEPNGDGTITKVDEDGTRTRGKIVGRKFIPA